ncbi:MAG: peptide ABC transporter permease [Legionella sp. 40-6]|nr:ABC transporter permease [Legionella sp.]OJY16526.1 MAG: peptide ABC transporter permease [Legionella sp. 40-6]
MEDVGYLWTDTLFLAILVIFFGFILWSLRKAHVRWRLVKIFRRPFAVSAFIVLLFFLTIGVLDSIHLTINNKTAAPNNTLLDHFLYPLGAFQEKTYSAPLALHQFVTDTVAVNGVLQQVYPLLVYPAPWIKNSADRWRLINHSIEHATLASSLILLMQVLVWIAWRHLGRRDDRKIHYAPLLSAWLTLGALTFITVLAFDLSRGLHILGTGQIGQDIFFYTVKSVRTGLIIGTLTTLFMLPFALLLGIIAGYFGGFIDDVIQYVYTTLSSIPGVLLITASVLSLQTFIANHPQLFTTLAQSADARLLSLCFILGVTSWSSLCRLLRAEALKLREVDFVMAAKSLGSSWFTIVRRHLLPNVMHIVVITLVLDFSFLVMAEALLSYVGAGVSPMTISWGNMINSARLELARDPVVWWPMTAAFALMFLLVLAMNIFADAVRDAFDPRY